MAQHVYIRRHVEGEPVPPGWKLVQVPGEGTYEIEEPLATEILYLLQRGREKSAKTLFFWFDTGPEEESP